MNDSANAETYYWDLISTKNIITEGKYSNKDLVQEAYETALPLMHNLFYIESDFIYLNLVCGLPQTVIAEIYGLSQLGVSKRVNGGMRKMKPLLEQPENDLQVVREDFYNLLPIRCREIAYLYYKNKVYSMVSKLTSESTSYVRKIVRDSVKILSDFIESNGKICARLTEEPYREFQDKKAYKRLLKDEEELDREILKAERYLKYFEMIQSEFNYGNFYFKVQSRDFRRTKLEI